MENKFIPDAIEIVGRAIKADNDGEYEQALNLYRDALGRFTMGLKYEKNESRKKLIIERVEGYMKRAEELRDYLNKQQELESKGGGGAASKKRGEGDDDDDAKEKSKLRGALSNAIVTEKPDVKWDDVAGLEGAKDSLKEVCTYMMSLVGGGWQVVAVEPTASVGRGISSICFFALPSSSRDVLVGSLPPASWNDGACVRREPFNLTFLCTCTLRAFFCRR